MLSNRESTEVLNGPSNVSNRESTDDENVVSNVTTLPSIEDEKVVKSSFEEERIPLSSKICAELEITESPPASNMFNSEPLIPAIHLSVVEFQSKEPLTVESPLASFTY